MPERDDTTVRVTLDTKKLIDKLADREDRTIRSVVERAIKAYAKKLQG